MKTEENGQSVLLVDDDKHLLVTMGDYLEFEGFTVRKANSGEEALRELRRHTPNLIVLDVSMPGMGGLGFLNVIKEVPGGAGIPVLILTARGSMRQFFEGLNADGFLTKPCSGVDLVDKIREILARGRHPVAVAPTRRGRILLVESSATNGQRLSESFTEAGYVVDKVLRGLDLFRSVASHRPDVLVMREMLPDMRGSALATMAKSHPLTLGIPCVVYDPSHFMELHDKNDAGRSTTIDVITTNDDAGVLLNAVDRLLGHAP